jgi:hypothetical protein
VDLLLIIAAIVVFVVAALGVIVLVVWLEWIDWPLDTLFNIGAGKGPLDVRAAADVSSVVLTVRNLGPNAMKLAAVEGRDAGGRRVFPTPTLEGRATDPAIDKAQRFKQLSRIALGPDESMTITLDRAELVEFDCRTLAIRDRSNRSWPAEGFDTPGREGGG